MLYQPLAGAQKGWHVKVCCVHQNRVYAKLVISSCSQNRKLRKSSTVLGRSTRVMQLFRFFQFFCFGCNFILSLQAVHGREINTWNDRAHSETNDEIAAQLFKKFVNTHERIYLNDSEEYNRRLAIFKVITFLYM